MKYYSEITKKMYDTHEELDKAEEEYKKELISKAKEEEEQKEKLESARKIRNEKRKEYTSSILACNRALSELKEADANVKDIENSIFHKKELPLFTHMPILTEKHSIQKAKTHGERWLRL